MNAHVKVLATFFGIGFFPLAPGTLASALVTCGYRFVLRGVPLPVSAVGMAVLFLLGVWSSGIYAAELGLPDPGRIVIDEVCGQFLVLLLIPGEWRLLVLGFVFFRLFDILKPFPIRKLEGLPGGWGIMSDDIGAGLAAALSVHLVLRLFRILEVT